MSDVGIACGNGYIISVAEQGPPGPRGPAGAGADTMLFTDLVDSPSTYTDQGGFLVNVNNAEDGVGTTDTVDGQVLTILLKSFTVAGQVPPTESLAIGELAVNIADGKLYVKKSDGTIVQIAGGTTETPAISTDGGTAFTVYLPGELIDGGLATSTYPGDTDIDGGTA